VPIEIWRDAETADVAARQSDRGLTPRVAALLVSHYTRPGEVIVDLTADPAIAGVAGAGGRRYFPLAAPAALTTLRHLRAAVALVVLRWPDPHDGGTQLAAVFHACRHLLTDGGYTVLALVPPADQTYLDHAQLVIPVARNTGLGYIRHIVSITAPIAQPESTDPSSAAGIRLHIDLLVLVIRDRRRESEF
jgi:hypothetical protein